MQEQKLFLFGTKHILLLLGIFLFATIIRMLPFSHIIADNAIYFYDGDCYLHLRKILLHLNDLPHFVLFDYYEGYPVGNEAITPPMLDFQMALICKIIGLGDPSTRTVELTAAFLPPIIGGISAVAVYYFTKEIFNNGVAIITILLFALMPDHVFTTVIGRPDNEMLEPLMIILLFFTYLKLTENKGSNTRNIIIMLVTGIIALFALFYSRSASIWITLLAIACILDITLDIRSHNVDWKRYTYYGGAFLTLFVCLIPLCYFNIWGNQNSFSYNIISWFHVALFGACGLVILLYGRIVFLWTNNRKAAKKSILIIVIPLITIIIAILLFIPSVYDNFLSAFSILGVGQTNYWIESISQYQPLFVEGSVDIWKPYMLFGWIFWLSPIVLIILLIKAFKGKLSKKIVFFVMFTIIALIITILRRRFSHVLSINMSILAGYLIWLVYDIIISSKFKTETLKKVAAVALSLFIAFILSYPLVTFAFELPNRHPSLSIKGDFHDGMQWLRDKTPSPGDPYKSKDKPDYSVMARWDFAGWIEYIGERPAVATLYGSEAYGLKESASFYLAEEESEANEILDINGSKYIIITETIGALEEYANIVGKTGNNYATLKKGKGFEIDTYLPGRKFLDLVYVRLMISDGSSINIGPTKLQEVIQYRLVYESSTNRVFQGLTRQVKKFKIFEYLPGASLEIFTEPGAEVSVVSEVRTNQGRSFPVVKKGIANANGEIKLTLTYSGSQGPDCTGLTRPYTIYANGMRKQLQVSEENLLGETLKINME